MECLRSILVFVSFDSASYKEADTCDNILDGDEHVDQCSGRNSKS